MAPKRSGKRKAATEEAAEGAAAAGQQAKPAAVTVKKEGKDTLCVLNKSGKELANAVQYRMRAAPQWIRDVYNRKVKYSKQMSPAEKKEWIEHLLSDEGFESEFFERTRKTEVQDVETTEAAWVSWKQVCDKESEEAAKIMVLQGTLETRPHRDLPLENPAVAALDWYVRQQFRYVVDREDRRIVDGHIVKSSDTAVPDEQEEPENPPKPEEPKNPTRECLFKVSGARASWLKVEPDLDMRLRALGGNEYIQRALADATKLMTTTKKVAKQVNNAVTILSAGDDIDADTLQTYNDQAVALITNTKKIKCAIVTMRQFANKAGAGSSSSSSATK